jgi:hypothetical protein
MELPFDKTVLTVDRRNGTTLIDHSAAEFEFKR